MGRLLRNFSVLFLFLGLFFCFSACEQNEQEESTAFPTASRTPLPSVTGTNTKTFIPSLTKISDLTPIPTFTQVNTRTNTATPIPSVVLPQVTLALIGTLLPEADLVMNSETLSNISKVGQWGRGSIRRVIFSPDGGSFIVGSAYGLAVYGLSDLQSPPRWLAFDDPFYYENMLISEDGQYVYMEMTEYRKVSQQVHSLADG